MRVNFVFKKDDEIEIGNYCFLFFFSVFSKIFEIIVVDFIIYYVFIENKLIIDK